MFLCLEPQSGQCQSEAESETIPVAIFEFQDLDSPVGRKRAATEDGTRGADGQALLGPKVSTLLFAELAANPNMVLVERDEIDKALDELELSLAGIIDPTKANQIGRMIGAKVLISGSIMKIDTKLYLIAKVIGTETSRVLGASAKGDVDKGIDPLVTKVAEDISKIVSLRANELLPKAMEHADRIDAIRKKIGSAELPSISINIQEQHIGQKAVDPAAQSELLMICKELGFTILDSASTEAKKADLILSGDGIAEFAVRRKNLVAVKARLELKVLDNSSKQVLASDRQTTMSVDLTEQIAGKAALQHAAMDIAERLIPKMLDERRKLSK